MSMLRYYTDDSPGLKITPVCLFTLVPVYTLLLKNVTNRVSCLRKSCLTLACSIAFEGFFSRDDWINILTRLSCWSWVFASLLLLLCSMLLQSYTNTAALSFLQSHDLGWNVLSGGHVHWLPSLNFSYNQKYFCGAIMTSYFSQKTCSWTAW